MLIQNGSQSAEVVSLHWIWKTTMSTAFNIEKGEVAQMTLKAHLFWQFCTAATLPNFAFSNWCYLMFPHCLFYIASTAICYFNMIFASEPNRINFYCKTNTIKRVGWQQLIYYICLRYPIELSVGWFTRPSISYPYISECELSIFAFVQVSEFIHGLVTMHALAFPYTISIILHT